MKTTKAIQNIEDKIEALGSDSLRRQALESAKNFKTSWMGLGQMLYTVWKLSLIHI